MLQICLQYLGARPYSLPNLVPPTCYSAVLALSSGEVMCLTTRTNLERKEKYRMIQWMEEWMINCIPKSHSQLVY